MKKLMVFVFFAAAAFLTAGECKNCGQDTDDCAVYRCKKCRTYFCDNCRDGEKKERTGFREVDQLHNFAFNLRQGSNGIVIICPECGAKGKKTNSGVSGGNIRLISE